MDGMPRLLRRCLLSGIALAAAALPSVALLPQAASAASVPNTALINADSVTFNNGITNAASEPISLEQYAAEKAGFTVTVRTGEEWEKMTAAEYAQFQVLIIGDPDCRSTAKSAVTSAPTWTPVVMNLGHLNPGVGNRTLVGTDPEFHYSAGGGGAQPKEVGNPQSAGAEHLVQDGIAFAGAVPGRTGVYFDTSCSDLAEPSAARVASAAETEPSPVQQELEGPDGLDKTVVLDHLTETAETWGEDVSPPCGGSVQQIASNAAFSEGPTKLLDSDIQGWQCSDHVTFPSFPADWFPLAVATDTASHPTCGTDPETGTEVCGEAYVLLAGENIVAHARFMTLTPENGSDPAGGSHAVTATVVKEGVPITNTKVGFLVKGTNAGVTGICTTSTGAADPECLTDGAGKVVFTYPDVNGVGTDSIVGTVTIEGTTERATATETWTPPPPPPPPPAPKTAVLASGSAHLASSKRACVASTGYVASISGKGIASVTYTLDGHKLKTLKKANSHGSFALRIKVKAGRSHHLSIRVAFTSASNTRAVTIKRTLARCAAKRKVAPRFTG